MEFGEFLWGTNNVPYWYVFLVEHRQWVFVAVVLLCLYLLDQPAEYPDPEQHMTPEERTGLRKRIEKAIGMDQSD